MARPRKKTRRPRGSGCVYERIVNGKPTGKYVAQIIHSYNEKGLPVKSIKTFRTKGEAERYLAEQYGKTVLGVPIDQPGGPTVEQWLEHWLDVRVKPNKGAFNLFFLQRVRRSRYRAGDRQAQDLKRKACARRRAAGQGSVRKVSERGTCRTKDPEGGVLCGRSSQHMPG